MKEGVPPFWQKCSKCGSIINKCGYNNTVKFQLYALGFIQLYKGFWGVYKWNKKTFETSHSSIDQNVFLS